MNREEGHQEDRSEPVGDKTPPAEIPPTLVHPQPQAGRFCGREGVALASQLGRSSPYRPWSSALRMRPSPTVSSRATNGTRPGLS